MNIEIPTRWAVIALLVATAPLQAAPVSFAPGSYETLAQDDWSADPGSLLTAHYHAVYPSGSVVVGSILGKSAVWTSPEAVLAYLPAVGAGAPFTTSYLDPKVTSAASFGGNVLALQLNVDFADAGLLPSAYGTLFGDLLISADLSGMPLASGVAIPAAFSGLTIRQFLASAHGAISGVAPFSTDFGTAAFALSEVFRGGIASEVAMRQLSYAPRSVPEPAALALLVMGIAWMAWTRRAHRQQGLARC